MMPKLSGLAVLGILCLAGCEELDAVTQDPDQWELIKAGTSEMVREDNRCVVEIGTYGREGQTAKLSAFGRLSETGLTVALAGLQGEERSLYYQLRAGDIGWPMVSGISNEGTADAELYLSNINNSIVRQMLADADSITLIPSNKYAKLPRFVFSGGNFASAAQKLAKCEEQMEAERIESYCRGLREDIAAEIFKIHQPHCFK